MTNNHDHEGLTVEQEEHIAAAVTAAIVRGPMPRGVKRTLGGAGGLMIAAMGACWTWGNQISAQVAEQGATITMAVSQLPKIVDRVDTLEKHDVAAEVSRTEMTRRLERIETKLDTLNTLLIERLHK